jgi:hypothetical protein
MKKPSRLVKKRYVRERMEKYHNELVSQLLESPDLIEINLGEIIFKEREFNPIKWKKYPVDSKPKPAIDLVLFDKISDNNYRCLLIEVTSSYEHELGIGYQSAMKGLRIYYNLGKEAMGRLGRNLAYNKNIPMPFYLELEGYVVTKEFGGGFKAIKPYFWKREKISKIECVAIVPYK